MKTTSLNQIFAFVLILIILGLIALLCFFSYKYPNTPQFVMFIIGYITGLLSLCGAYLFGSTKGSQDKDSAIKDSMDNAINQLAQSNPATK